MPKYRVIKPGFMGDTLYRPNGKHSTVSVDKAFKKCPSWLEPIKEASATQRPAKGTKGAKAAKEVSFMDAPKTNTETL